MVGQSQGCSCQACCERCAGERRPASAAAGKCCPCGCQSSSYFGCRRPGFSGCPSKKAAASTQQGCRQCMLTSQTRCGGQASQQGRLTAHSTAPLGKVTQQAGTPRGRTPPSERAYFEHDVGEVVEVSGLDGNPCVGSTPGSQGGCDHGGCIPCYHASPAVAAAVSWGEGWKLAIVGCNSPLREELARHEERNVQPAEPPRFIILRVSALRWLEWLCQAQTNEAEKAKGAQPKVLVMSTVQDHVQLMGGCGTCEQSCGCGEAVALHRSHQQGRLHTKARSACDRACLVYSAALSPAHVQVAACLKVVGCLRMHANCSAITRG